MRLWILEMESGNWPAPKRFHQLTMVRPAGVLVASFRSRINPSAFPRRGLGCFVRREGGDRARLSRRRSGTTVRRPTSAAETSLPRMTGRRRSNPSPMSASSSHDTPPHAGVTGPAGADPGQRASLLRPDDDDARQRCQRRQRTGRSSREGSRRDLSKNTG